LDPITLTVIATLTLLGGGFALYKTKPEVFAKIPGLGKLAGPRAITLDATLPDAGKQEVIAAIMTSKSAAQLQPVAQKYAAYPWASFELRYRAWELDGSKGAAPQPPVGGGVSVPEVMPGSAASAAQAAANPQTAADLAAQAAAMAAQAAHGGAPAYTPVTVPQNVPVPAGPPPAMAGVPQPPFDLSAASQHGAWQTDSAYIRAYQSALTYLAVRDGQPAWNPGGVDGKYGPHTGAAVLAFQRAKGLSADGECGRDCAAALAAAIGGSQTAGAQMTGAQGGYATAATMPMAQPSMQEHVAGGTQSVDRGSAGGRASAQEGVAGAPAAAPAGPFRRFAPSAEALRDAGFDEPVAGDNPTPNAVVHAAAGTRPAGTPFVRIRSTDKVYPRTIATIGTGSDRAGTSAIKHLVDINPHLAPTGIISQLTSGMEVNVPQSWAAPLKARGFAVFTDDGKEFG
jgi:peptidoglycan hydrolase-like protein with peptidoglycan-binding domain